MMHQVCILISDFILILAGRAVIWPNVLDTDDTDTADLRTRHQATKVIKGVKYAANKWIHNYNFDRAMRYGCYPDHASIVKLYFDHYFEQEQIRAHNSAKFVQRVIF